MTIRAKKCKNPDCRKEFTPVRPLQSVCSIQCSMAVSRIKGARNGVKLRAEQAKERRNAKEALKTRAEWIKDAQKAFNAFIRERDKSEPCISCGRYHHGQYHAGHYRTIKAAPELRFNELNVHKQCAPCNNNLSGNILAYRIGLIKKIGQDKVDLVEGPHELQHYTIDDCKQIIATYRNKLKLLKEKT